MKPSKKRKKATAPQPGKETATAGDPVKKKIARKDKKVKIEITGMVAWMGWSWGIGQVVWEDKNQAQEAVDAGRAKYVE